MSERHVTLDLLAYLDGELDFVDTHRVKAHLEIEKCEACLAELERLRAVRQDLGTTMHRAMDPVRLPRAADERIREQLERHKQGAWWASITTPFDVGRRMWRWRAAAAYAVLALLIVAFIVPTWQAAHLPTVGPRQETLVLGQTTLTPGTQAALRVLVRNPDTAQPTPDAQVTISLAPKGGKSPGLASPVWRGRTDKLGTAQVAFTVPDQAEGEAELVVETRSDMGTSTVSHAITIKRSFKLYLSSDKPLYQPGQTIHMRALALGAADSKPAAGQPIEFIVTDAAGNKIYREKFTASNFGIASTDLPLASELIQGDYKLEARLGDTTSTKTVQVKPYVLPKFKVTLETDRQFYRPAEKVTGKLQADYFFGKPTSEAQVTLKGFVRDVGRTQVINLTGQTDAEGRFEFEFNAPDYMVAPSARKALAYLELEAEVIDQAQHTENAFSSLPITDQAILIDAVPESGALKPGVENIIYLLASYPDGRPAQATLHIEAAGSPYVVDTGEYGLGELRFTPPAGQLALKVTARDAAGMTGDATLSFQSEAAAETILLRVERAAYRVGDTLKLEVLTAGSSGAVYLDVVKEGQTLATHALQLDKGRGTLAIDLDANYLGTLELDAYRVLPKGDIVRDTRLVVVDASNQLDIAVTSDREVYRPGDQASVAITTSVASKGTQSALGIGVVDESVYALAEQQPGFERLYFLLEQELLNPKTEVHGFDVPTLMSPQTPPQVRDAQDRSAQAAWAGLPGTQFSLQLKTLLDRAKDYLKAKLNRFNQIGTWLARAIVVLPLLMVIVVIWGLRPTGVLGGAIRRIGVVLRRLILTFFIPLAIIGGCLWVTRQALGLFALVLTLLAWLTAWLMLAWYAWRRDDPRAQLTIGLTAAYMVLGGLLVYVAEFNSAVPTTMNVWIIVTGVAVTMLALVTLGQGLVLEGAHQSGWATTVMGVLLIPLTFYLTTLPGVHSPLAQTLGDVRLYAAAGNLLTGCAPAATPAAPAMPAATMAPAAQPEQKQVAATSAPAPTQPPAPTQAPAATRPAQATPLPAATATPVAGKEPGPAAQAEQPRLRQFFPETLYWLPEAVTDKNGHVQLNVPMADSITTWRLTAIANTQDGRIGATTHGMRVFQDFFIDLDLPVALTQGDEVRVPVAVYNYLTQTQQVKLVLEPDSWFTLAGDSVQQLSIAANDITVAYFSIKVNEHGRWRLTVTAWGTRMSDAIAKEVQVVPNGTEKREGVSNRLGDGATVPIQVPDTVVPGTVRVQVKLYPGAASQIVEGLDGLLRMPSGCFEQTSSMLYPDILVLDYLKQTGQLEAKPQLAMQAEQYIATGYQRLLTFEVKGTPGGFSLFGEPPASLMHTAYGLMEFADMSRVYSVDPALIDRIARWLLSQQSPDGSWDTYALGYSHFQTWQKLSNAKMPMTAYLTWALVEAGYGQEPGVSRARAYLASHLNEADDPYVLALVANALVAADARSSEAQMALTKLAQAAVVDQDTATWPSNVASYTGAEGRTANLETTSMAVYALLRGGGQAERAQQGLDGLIQAKDTFGTWETTQATVLALKAFLLSTKVAGETPVQATVAVSLDGRAAQSVTFDQDNAGVVQTIFFDDVAPGQHTVSLKTSGQAPALLYQVTTAYYVPWKETPVPSQTQALNIQVSYDRSTLAVDDTIGVQAEVTFNQSGAAQWVIVDLGVPPGFNVLTEDLDELIAQSASLKTHIKRYEMTGRSVILYLENMTGTIRFNYRMKARLAVKAQTPASTVYDYYNPEVRSVQQPVQVVVNP
jgi:uncharacterized protein YfaS (alpha-2-macroglobulin family)